MQESFERKQKQAAKSYNGQAKNGDLTKSRQRIIEEPHQTTEYDVDDLINELSGQESWKKKLGKQDKSQSELIPPPSKKPPQLQQSPTSGIKMKIGGNSSKSNNSNRRQNDDDFQSATDFGGSGSGTMDKLSRQLFQLKSKYLNKVPTTT